MPQHYLGGRTAPWHSSADWLTMFPITQSFGGRETGIDIGNNFNTPILSLTAGQVLGAGYYDGGGVVSVACEVNGKPAAIYYQHLDRIEPGVLPGAAVRIGQRIGYSGGQLIGGTHPSIARYSNGAHMEVGFNAPYGGFWNPKGYTPNFDPQDALYKLVTGGAVGSAGQSALDAVQASAVGPAFGPILQLLLNSWRGVSSAASNSGAVAVQISTQVGFVPVAQAIHDAETFRPLDPSNLFGSVIHTGGVVMFRAMIVALGMLILAAIVARIARRAYNAAAQDITQGAQTAAGAVTAAAAFGAI